MTADLAAAAEAAATLAHLPAADVIRGHRRGGGTRRRRGGGNARAPLVAMPPLARPRRPKRHVSALAPLARPPRRKRHVTALAPLAVMTALAPLAVMPPNHEMRPARPPRPKRRVRPRSSARPKASRAVAARKVAAIRRAARTTDSLRVACVRDRKSNPVMRALTPPHYTRNITPIELNAAVEWACEWPPYAATWRGVP